MKYGFLILHYMDLETTCNCVKNVIKKFGNSDIQIVVVDNASPNGSGKKLQAIFAQNERIEVLLSKENVGFAKGNNLGFDYLKKNFDLDYMIVMNNDIDIRDSEFLVKIANEEEQTQFDVLGPDIITVNDKKHQNPAHMEGFSSVELKKLKDTYEKMSKAYPYYYFKGKVVSFLKQSLHRSKDIAAPKVTERKINVVLHGACYIFSKNFIQRRAYLFYPETFMYFEEDILHYDCQISNLKMVYSPFLKVYHVEDASTNATFSSQYGKEKFKLENMLNSITAFIAHINNQA